MKKAMLSLLLTACLLAAGCNAAAPGQDQAGAGSALPLAAPVQEADGDASPDANAAADDEALASSNQPLASYTATLVCLISLEQGCIEASLDQQVEGQEPLILHFLLQEDSLFFDAQGESLDPATLQPGDLLRIYTDSYAPAPLVEPPQYQADIVILEDPEAETPVFSCADSFFRQGDLLVGAGLTLALRLEDRVALLDRNAQPASVEKASLDKVDLLVFYQSSTRSLPAQTTPNKVIVLGQPSEQALAARPMG